MVLNGVIMDGLTANGIIPTQKSTWNKLQKLDEKCTSESEKRGNNCGRPGVNGGYIANPYVKWRKLLWQKTKATADDIRYMKAEENQLRQEQNEN